jgi:C1A family cysteine protease
VAGSAAIPSNDDLKDALCQYGPLVVAIFGDTAWHANQGDVITDTASGFKDNTGSLAVNHAVVLVGWDDSQNNNNGAWIIKNSWGTGYGIQDSGFLYIGYNYQNLGYSAAYVVPGPAVPIQP